MDDLQEQLRGCSARPKEYAAGADQTDWYAISGLHPRASTALGLEGMRLWNIATPMPAGIEPRPLHVTRETDRFPTLEALALTMVLLGTGAAIT